MKIKIKLFDVYIFLIALLKGFGLASNNKVYWGAFFIGIYALAIKMMNEKYSRRELFSMAVIMAIGCLSFVFGNETAILFSAITICGLKKVDLNRVISISCWTRIFAYVSVLFVYGTGIVDSESVMFLRNGEYIKRYMFCYGHPNMAHFMFSIIVVHLLYLYSRKMKGHHYIAIAIANYLVYTLTYSRTGLLTIYISLMIFYIIKYQKIFVPMAKIMRYSYVLFLAFTIITALLYGRHSLIDLLDSLTTGRIYYNNILLTDYSVSLFGNSAIGDKTIIDNGYLSLLYEGGGLAFLWFSYYIMKISNVAYKNRRWHDLALITSCLTYNLMEGFLSSTSINIALFLIGPCIFKGKKDVQYAAVDDIYSDIQPSRYTGKSV